MSAHATHLVWTQSKAAGVQKLLLLALADHANRDLEVHLSMRDMAVLCGVSKTRISAIIDALISLGELRILSTGGGRKTPNKYWITLQSDQRLRECKNPEPSEVGTKPIPDVLVTESKIDITAPSVPLERKAPVVTQKTPNLTFSSVQSVLDAAQVAPDGERPFFWQRREHIGDLFQLLDETGLSLQGLCEALRGAASRGERLEAYPHRITDLRVLLKDRAL